MPKTKKMSHGTVKNSNTKNGNGHAPAPTNYDSQTLAPPPDGGWGWVVVFASFMVHVISKYGLFLNIIQLNGFFFG